MQVMASSCQAPGGEVDEAVIRAAPRPGMAAASAPVPARAPRSAAACTRAGARGLISRRAPRQNPSGPAGTRRCVALLDEKACANPVRAARLHAGGTPARRGRSPWMYPRRSASGFGKKILVGVCSMMVRLMGLASTSLGALGRQAHDGVELAPGLGPVLGEAFEGGSASRRQNSSIQHTRRPAVQQLAHQMEQVQRERRAQ